MKHIFLADLSGRQKTVVFALITIVVLILLIQTFGKAYRSYGYDFTSYLLSAEALLQGENPYTVDTPFPYIYPLFLAFALIPLAVLPYWMANFIWFGLSITALYVSAREVVKAAPNEIGTRWGWHLAVPLLFIFLILFPPIHSNFLNGQVNLIVLVACVMFFRKLMQGQQLSGAAWLAVAIAIKLLPAIFLGFLLVRGKFRFILLTILFTAALLLLPILVGGEQIFTYYAHYIDSFLLRGISDIGGESHLFTGFNLQSLVAYFSPALGQALWIRGISLLVIVVLVLGIDLRNGRPSVGEKQVWSFCAYLIGALLLSPMGETHHLVLALPAVTAVGLKFTTDLDWRTTGIKCLVIIFAMSFFLLPKIMDVKPLYFIPLSILLVLLQHSTSVRQAQVQ